MLPAKKDAWHISDLVAIVFDAVPVAITHTINNTSFILVGTYAMQG